MAFWLRGANPFAGASQAPMQLLQSITAAQLASCVPFIKITKIDKFGKPATDVRPLMYDLVQTPQFGATGNIFGTDQGSYIERSLVTLDGLTVDFHLNYGQQMFREVTLEFTVQRPEVVFDRNSKVAWREIMEAGKSFSLEYGWSADRTLVDNELFNGVGVVTDNGLVIKGTQSVLLNVYTYSPTVTRTGQVKVVVKALENGDLALRETKFSDAFESTFNPGQPEADDLTNGKRLKTLLDGLVRRTEDGRGSYYLMGDILDQIIAPVVSTAANRWGYVGSGPPRTYNFYRPGVSVPAAPVTLLLGDFNSGAGPQSKNYGSKPMNKPWDPTAANGAGKGGIGDFRVPTSVVNSIFSRFFAQGRTLYLNNLISMVVNVMNGEEAWAHPPVGQTYRQPSVLLRSDTVRNPDGTYGLVMVIYDQKVATDPFHTNDRLDLGSQSRAQVMAKLASLDVPVLEFTRAGSLVLDANFVLQPDTLLQSNQVDGAYRDQKTREQITATPNVQQRVGMQRSGELIMPVSIVEGDVEMYGNFALEAFALLWVDFFGSSEISGVFHVIGKTDRLSAGKFASSFKLISEGIDPLNTRRQKTATEFAEDQAAAAAVTKKKPPTS